MIVGIVIEQCEGGHLNVVFLLDDGRSFERSFDLDDELAAILN